MKKIAFLIIVLGIAMAYFSTQICTIITNLQFPVLVWLFGLAINVASILLVSRVLKKFGETRTTFFLFRANVIFLILFILGILSSIGNPEIWKFIVIFTGLGNSLLMIFWIIAIRSYENKAYDIIAKDIITAIENCNISFPDNIFTHPISGKRYYPENVIDNIRRRTKFGRFYVEYCVPKNDEDED